ncbi:MAG: GNAT family N-acetyltransferase [Bacteroidetes bacterium]|nr:GNAT family N-acetyltransferase [Bacteroidota bacterium]
MIRLSRTDSSNPDFQSLVQLLDAELRQRDGEEHAFFAQFNKIDQIRQVVVAYDGEIAVGCGAVKPYDAGTMEVKRMYVRPEARGKRIAVSVLRELEKWTRESGYRNCILETGERQPEAIALYTRCGYERIPNYGQYAQVATSVCFHKTLE